MSRGADRRKEVLADEHQQPAAGRQHQRHDDEGCNWTVDGRGDDADIAVTKALEAVLEPLMEACEEAGAVAFTSRARQESHRRERGAQAGEARFLLLAFAVVSIFALSGWRCAYSLATSTSIRIGTTVRDRP